MLYDGEHLERNMELSAMTKVYYYIYVITKKHEYKWPKQHYVRKTCSKNRFTMWKLIVFDSMTMDPVMNKQFKITWLSWGSNVLVIYDGEFLKRNMYLSALIKAYYYIYVLTKSMMYVWFLVKSYTTSSLYQ